MTSHLGMYLINKYHKCRKPVIPKVYFVPHAIVPYIIQLILTTLDSREGKIECSMFVVIQNQHQEDFREWWLYDSGIYCEYCVIRPFMTLLEGFEIQVILTAPCGYPGFIEPQWHLDGSGDHSIIL